MSPGGVESSWGGSVEGRPFLYIVGCPRSGTTLVRRMLDAHPHLVVSRSTHWVTLPFRDPAWMLPGGRVTSAFAERLLSFRRFGKMQLNAERVRGVAARAPDYPSFVSEVYGLFGEQQGKRLVGDKTPAYVRWMPLLHFLFPRCKFVHLIRDGRSVSLSLLDPKNAKKIAQLSAFRTWNEDRLLTAAFKWESDVRIGAEAGAYLGPSAYHEVRYESLVQDPGVVVRGICDFLGLPYEDSMVRFHEGKTKPDPALDAKHRWLPVTPGLRDWRSQMEEGSLQRVEAAAGPLLRDLGYETVTEVRPGGEIDRLRSMFGEDMRRAVEPLPLAWTEAQAVAG
jgi:hypothetical protein